MTLNPLGSGLAGLGQGIGSALTQRRMEGKLQGLLQGIQGGDPAAMQELMTVDPQAAALMQRQQAFDAESQQAKTAELQKAAAVIANTALGITDPAKRRAYLIQRMNSEQDPDIKAELADTLNMDDDQMTYDLQEAVSMLAGIGKENDGPASVQEWQHFNSLSKEDQERYLTMKRSNKFFTMGDVPMVASQTGADAVPLSTPGVEGLTQPEIQAALSGQEASKQAGITGAKAQTEADIEKATKQPSQVADLDQSIDLVKRMLDSPGRAKATGLNSRFPTMAGSDAANYETMLEQLKSRNFLASISQMKGMGQLSNNEGMKLEAALAALDLRQSDNFHKEELERLREQLTRFKRAVLQDSKGAKPAEQPKAASIDDLVNQYAD